MDRLEKFRQQTQLRSFTSIVLCCALLATGFFAGHQIGGSTAYLIYGGTILFTLAAAWALSAYYAKIILEPLTFIWRAVLHVSPDHSQVSAPNLDQSHVARELVTNLVLQIYQLASSGSKLAAKPASTAVNPISEDIAHNLPLPLFAVNKDQNIDFVNEAALHYLGLPESEVLHKNLYSVLDLLFSEEDTLDTWLQNCRMNKATDTHSWKRVRLKLADQPNPKQFDMAAAYSKENPAGIEVMLTLFDQTSSYQTDDQGLDFIALAVHELRTPLTSLRGYIEVFEDELSGKLDPELSDFMHKMQAAAQQLTAFVGNVLNVARIQEGELTLQLAEEHWPAILQSCVTNLSLAAQLNGVTVKVEVDPLVPPVAVDKISISEVLNNLLDNAIKYSGNGKTVMIKATMTNDGLVETTVADNGVGIPESVMPTLFEKFHRNHRNQATIGGTGLGLYLSSSLVKAHGGNIWLKSKEGEGTTVGFTVQPYSMVAGKLKDSNNTDIVRNAHGWIKNHSLYRR